jgi:hypothetical protein
MVCGSYDTSSHPRKLSQLFQQRSPEHDNRYVWFTRDIHDEDANNQRKIFLKKLNKILSRKDANTKLNKF